MGKLLVPPRYEPLAGPVIFLAGPIQCASDWQADAAGIIRGLSPAMTVASPRRNIDLDGDFGEKDYDEQVDWEHFHLDYAGRNGAILFWLAKEAVHRCDRAYAQTTRFELGEAATLHRLAGVRLVIGIENGFTGARYVRRTLGKKAPDVPICASLAETCRRAVEMAESI